MILAAIASDVNNFRYGMYAEIRKPHFAPELAFPFQLSTQPIIFRPAMKSQADFKIGT